MSCSSESGCLASVSLQLPFWWQSSKCVPTSDQLQVDCDFEITNRKWLNRLPDFCQSANGNLAQPAADRARLEVLTLALFLCFPKRLSSLLIMSQLVNQVTEVVVPYLVDRFVNASNRTESEDDPEEDKFRKQSTLPTYPVSVHTCSQKFIWNWSGIRRFYVHLTCFSLICYRACLQSTLSSWCSLAIWVCSPVCIRWQQCCCSSTTLPRSGRMPTRSANSSVNLSPPLWPAWAFGRSAK